ncbi:MAG: Flp pilus assembly protein CpaB [Phycisphaeraceae bacterium]|nr:Flp pilus assembly protein CpaB [Phycisphaeraceae bacterium]
MAQKLPIIGLVLAGLVAAVCASVLAASLRARPAVEIAPDRHVTVLVAARDLPAMTRIESDALVERTIPTADATAQHVRSSVSAIGRILITPLLEGQAVTESCFAGEDPGMQMATALPPGMRAVSVELANHAALRGILYPGCTVDVLGSFRFRPLRRDAGQALSTTLLQGIRVLAVDKRTSFSPNDDEGNDPAPRHRKPTVTLMVDSGQAKTLQLAMEHGAVSLALRNPADDKSATDDATVLRDGKLESFDAMFDVFDDGQEEPEAALMFGDGPEPEQDPVWQTTVIRGVTTEVRSMPLPKVKSH